MANISIDSSVLEEVVSKLNSDNQSLANMKSSLSQDFVGITNAGLFEKQLKEMTEKLEKISSAYSSISSEVSNHLSEYVAVEDNVSQVANDYMSYYSYTGGGGGGGRSRTEIEDSGELYVEIESKQLDDVIKDIDNKTLISLINFINSNKKDDLTINELLMNEEYNTELANLLKKFYKDQMLQDISISDETLIKKELLKKILNTDLELTADLKENSLIGYKVFLQSIATKYNTDIYTLLTDVKYTQTISTYLANLYSGSTADLNVQLDTTLITNFKTMVDTKARNGGYKVEEMLSNPLLLV